MKGMNIPRTFIVDIVDISIYFLKISVKIAVSSAHFLIIFPFFQRGVEGSGAATRCPSRGGALSGYGIWLDGIW
jgi:hypothetical protein